VGKVDMTENEVETVLDIMDIDQDGRVSLDDFMVSCATAVAAANHL
jgi:Ca2+-binding EF-hand superfamily protein